MVEVTIGAAGELEDSMESFFLSETSKYLFLLQANATDLPDHYIFTTEGHLLPPFAVLHQPVTALESELQTAGIDTGQLLSWAASWGSWLPRFGNWLPYTTPQNDVDIQISPAASEAASLQCASMCTDVSWAQASHKLQLLQSALPLLPLALQDANLLR